MKTIKNVTENDFDVHFEKNKVTITNGINELILKNQDIKHAIQQNKGKDFFTVIDNDGGVIVLDPNFNDMLIEAYPHLS